MDREQLMAQDDRCWDGNWMADGYDGMFVFLTQDDFCDSEWEEFLEEQEEEKNCSKKMCDEFLIVPSSEEDWANTYQETLQPRNLQIASGVIHIWTQDCCPSRIRICQLDDEEMAVLLEQKILGNKAFSDNDYKKALEYYEEALMALCVHAPYVAPVNQMNEIIKILSNQAECYLQLKQYGDAGRMATYALLIDSDHVKSRLRRAKAELAIAKAPYLIQAQVDLHNIIFAQDEEGRLSSFENNNSGTEQAKACLTEVEDLLIEERKKHEEKNPNTDWDLFVRMMKSKCW